MPDDEPKIIIDEDWKSQVQREKEEAAEKAQEAEPAEQAAEADQAVAAEEASFSGLVSTLAAQAMFALGVIAPRDAKEVTVNLDQAKYLIDTLQVLRDKTAGNLTPEEEGGLKEALAELQRLYVGRVQQIQEQAMRQAGINPQELSR